MHGVETILNVLGSVALLLWGVRMVRTGLTRAFGAALRRAIAACSRNRFTAFAGRPRPSPACCSRARPPRCCSPPSPAAA